MSETQGTPSQRIKQLLEAIRAGDAGDVEALLRAAPALINAWGERGKAEMYIWNPWMAIS